MRYRNAGSSRQTLPEKEESTCIRSPSSTDTPILENILPRELKGSSAQFRQVLSRQLKFQAKKLFIRQIHRNDVEKKRIADLLLESKRKIKLALFRDENYRELVKRVRKYQLDQKAIQLERRCTRIINRQLKAGIREQSLKRDKEKYEKAKSHREYFEDIQREKRSRNTSKPQDAEKPYNHLFRFDVEKRKFFDEFIKHGLEFTSENSDSNEFSNDIEFSFPFIEYCCPTIEEVDSSKKFKLPTINPMNIQEWFDRVMMELRAENPKYSSMLQYGLPKWMSIAEEVSIRMLLNAGNEADVSIHEAVINAAFRTVAATRAYTALDLKEREKDFQFFNAKLYGLLERACIQCPEALVYIKIDLKNFQELGGDITKISGRALLNNLVLKFNRDTTRTKGEKLKAFYGKRLHDYQCNTGTALCTSLEKDAIELVRVGEFSEESVPNHLMDRFIDAINNDTSYSGLCGVLRARREDILGGLTWEALKEIVRRDDVDRVSRVPKRDKYYSASASEYRGKFQGKSSRPRKFFKPRNQAQSIQEVK
jgi:hypothetical protein